MLRYAQPYRVIFYISVKEAQLRMDFFPLKFMQITKNFMNIMHHSRFFADFVEEAHQFHIPGTAAVIAISELPDIDFFQTGKMPVQLGIEIFPIAIPEGQTHVKAKHTFHSGIDAAFQNSFDIFPCVIYIRKDGAQPHHRGDF